MFLIFVSLVLLYLGTRAWQRHSYEQTEYFQQTHNSYHNVREDAGRIGEFSTYRELAALDGYKKYLFNCYLPKSNGETTELDVILLHESGIYVFESKNYSGWIFGSEGAQSWTQVLPAGRGRTQKHPFFNPILQNRSHVRRLRQLLDIHEDLVYSFIVFSERCTLKDIRLTSGEHVVVKTNELLRAVRSKARQEGCRLSPAQIDRIYRKLLPLTQIDEQHKKLHAQQIQARYGDEFRQAPQPGGICPRCGGRLVQRTASRGPYAGQKFWGCSNYPKCHYIQKAA